MYKRQGEKHLYGLKEILYEHPYEMCIRDRDCMAAVSWEAPWDDGLRCGPLLAHSGAEFRSMGAVYKRQVWYGSAVSSFGYLHIYQIGFKNTFHKFFQILVCLQGSRPAPEFCRAAHALEIPADKMCIRDSFCSQYLCEIAGYDIAG